ncbi:hypothetical protein GALL_528050 [mine drainage metagenome]|uniref:Uncharacterized protein n=1 Tax=mine drainage metagenome TaxID=410659 RepID=A0A1J5P250_9ZZZZ
MAPGGLAEGTEHQIFQHRQLGKQPSSLGDQRHAEIDDRLSRQLCQIMRLSVDRQRHASALWPNQARDALHQRALAVTIGAKQCNGFASLNMKRDAAQRFHSAVTRIEVIDGKAKCQGRPPAHAG